MGVRRNIWSCIGLTQYVDCYLVLWNESVPQWWREKRQLSWLIRAISVGLTVSVLFTEVVSVCTWIVRLHCCFVVLIVCVDGRAVSEVYLLTVACDAVDPKVGHCTECIPHVFTSLADWCFAFICVCGGFIDGDLFLLGYVMFVHYIALIICYFYGYIDE